MPQNDGPQSIPVPCGFFCALKKGFLPPEALFFRPETTPNFSGGGRKAQTEYPFRTKSDPQYAAKGAHSQFMTDKNLKKLSRAQLLEILVQQAERIDELEEELDRTKEELESRRIKLEKAGSIAEAALSISGVFEDAQRAADIYLRNIMDIS